MCVCVGAHALIVAHPPMPTLGEPKGQHGSAWAVPFNQTTVPFNQTTVRFNQTTLPFNWTTVIWPPRARVRTRARTRLKEATEVWTPLCN